MRQRLFQGLNTNPITDPLLKSMKGRLYPKGKMTHLLRENENNSEAKLYTNHWMIHLSFYCLSFTKQSYLVFELYYLSTH